MTNPATTPTKVLQDTLEKVREIAAAESEPHIAAPLAAAITGLENAIARIEARHDAAMRAAYGPKG